MSDLLLSAWCNALIEVKEATNHAAFCGVNAAAGRERLGIACQIMNDTKDEAIYMLDSLGISPAPLQEFLLDPSPERLLQAQIAVENARSKLRVLLSQKKQATKRRTNTRRRQNADRDAWLVKQWTRRKKPTLDALFQELICIANKHGWTVPDTSKSLHDAITKEMSRQDHSKAKKA